MYDHIVIGAGIVGSCTARYLQSRNRNVLLLEQHSIRINQGGSSGLSRVIRKSYAEKHFAEMMGEAYEMWKEIEKESVCNVFIQTGMLLLGKDSSDVIDACCKNIKNITGEHLKEIDEKIMKEKYPHFSYSDEYKKFYEETGGVIFINKALSAIQELFQKMGGVICDFHKVIDIIPGDTVLVKTTMETFQTPSLIICAGPWTNQVLQSLHIQLPIKTPKVRVYYWKKKECVELEKKYPVFIDFDGVGTHVYGLPTSEYPGHVKISVFFRNARNVSEENLINNPARADQICAHGGDNCNPDQKETTGMTDYYVDKLCHYIQEHFPELEHEKPGIVETCIYSKTPDECFILDHHPVHKNIIIGAGFSGTGCKTAPVVGKILGELALDISPSYNLEPFLISRFQ